MNTIITIGRESGSAGHKIGKLLAEELGIPCYDRELLEKASEQSGLSRELFDNHDEKPTNSFLYSLVMGSYVGGYTNTIVSEMPLNQKVFLAQFETIKSIAAEGPCVFIGRCADYALELDERLLSVFIHADIEARIQRVSKEYGLTNAKAREFIMKQDKSRSSYYNYYTTKKWGATGSYNMTVDSGLFGIEGSVALIKKAVELKEAGGFSKIYDNPEE